VEVVRDGRNGFLLPPRAPAEIFATHLKKLHASAARRRQFGRAALATAREFSQERCAARAIEFYQEIRRATRRERRLTETSTWGKLGQRLALEWELLAQKTQTIVAAVTGEPAAKAS
jgi:1,2-diacylglycerol 3-alpha-glucosyltransferase